MNDRELIELAAKAAGIEGAWDARCGQFRRYANREAKVLGEVWKPLSSLAHAKNLRHLCKLTTGFDARFTQLGLCAYASYRVGPISINSIMQNVAEAGSKRKALRRAIVRAAAELGKLS